MFDDISFVQEKVIESSSKSSQLQPSRPGAHPYHVPEVQLDDEDGISYEGSFSFTPPYITMFDFLS